MTVAFTAWDYQVTYLELIACALAVVAVAAAAQGKRWAWPFYFASALAYGWLFIQYDLLASAVLQVIFMVAAVWGWIDWGRGGIVAPRSLRLRARALWLGGALLAWVVLTPVLSWVGATATIPDGFVLIGSVAAQVLMVKGYVEAWPAWAIVNVVGTFHYARQELYFTSLLYFILLVMAAYGWWAWARRQKTDVPTVAADPELAAPSR